MHQLKVFCFCAVFVSVIASKSEEEKCESKFCEEDPNYPEKILNTLGLWKYNFDKNPLKSRARRSTDFKSDAYLVETKLCKSNIVFHQPQKLKNINGELRTIVNHKNYTQIVRMETCEAENFPCTFNIYPKSVRSFCNQNYDTIQLVALDDRKNCLVTERFEVPSSCACAINKEDFMKGVSRDLLKRS